MGEFDNKDEQKTWLLFPPDTTAYLSALGLNKEIFTELLWTLQSASNPQNHQLKIYLTYQHPYEFLLLPPNWTYTTYSPALCFAATISFLPFQYLPLYIQAEIRRSINSDWPVREAVYNAANMFIQNGLQLSR